MNKDGSRRRKNPTVYTSVLLYLLAVLSGPAFSADTEELVTISIAFSNGDPPTSWASDNTKAQGLLPELAEAVFKRISDVQLDAKPYPWPRAKLMAENGQVDGLLTFPSESRQAFLLFTEEPTYIIDYGYIIFNRENPRAEQLSNLEDYRQLSDFMMITEGPEVLDSWEDQNLDHDAYPRMYVNNVMQMFHLLFRRQSGDYFIRNLEEAKYIAHDLGYEGKFAYRKILFENQNIIPFHLGIQKAHPKAEIIIDKINALQRSPDFKKEAQDIVRRYQ